MAVNRGPRNDRLLEQISPNNPFRKTFPRAFDIGAAYEKDRENIFGKDQRGVELRRDLSPEGKRGEARKAIRRALSDLHDLQKPLVEYHAQTEQMKSKVRLPDYDKSSYAARLRAEMRDRSYYDMTPQQRIGLLAGKNRSSAFFDAVSEQEPFVSGLREKSELDVLAAAKTERLAELHAPLLATIAERESTFTEAMMIANVVRGDVQSDSGLRREEFEAEIRAVEPKATAEAPKAPPTAPGQDALPSAEVEAIWAHFDQLAAAATA